MLAIALALVAALVPPAEPEADLRGTSIVLVEGGRRGGGYSGRHHIVTFGYDWNRGSFRLVEQYPEPGLVISPYRSMRAFRALDFESDRFRKLVEHVVELGLPELPLEMPAGGEDIYGRNASIRFSRDGRVWENKPFVGCIVQTSTVRVTPEQLAAFDAVIALLDSTLAQVPLQPASALDELVPRDRSALQVHALARAVEVLRGMGRAGEVNANAATFELQAPPALRVRIPSRAAQPSVADGGKPVPPLGWWDLRLSPDGERVEEVHETPVPGEQAECQARRRAFVDAHPELPAPQRDMILAGWVADGMSEEMVCAAWGPPVERKAESTEVVLRYVRGARYGPALDVTLRVGADGLQLFW